MTFPDKTSNFHDPNRLRHWLVKLMSKEREQHGELDGRKLCRRISLIYFVPYVRWRQRKWKRTGRGAVHLILSLQVMSLATIVVRVPDDRATSEMSGAMCLSRRTELYGRFSDRLYKC